MAKVHELAHEYGMEPYGLRAFADDLLDGVPDDNDEIPADTERTLREALAQDAARVDMAGVNPTADPVWVAARDRAGAMTATEADAYYAARERR